jgi:hypothetical protein
MLARIRIRWRGSLMDGSQIFTKTALGTASFAGTNGTLTQAERTLLIMIDGNKPMSDIRRFNAVLGDCDALAERLLQQGFIEPVAKLMREAAPTVSATQFSKARMSEIRSTASRFVAHALGSYGDKLCGQIDAVGDIEALRIICATAEDVLAHSKGPQIAAEFREKVAAKIAVD